MVVGAPLRAWPGAAAACGCAPSAGPGRARYGLCMGIDAWAEAHARDLLAPLGNRWRHTQGVAQQAAQAALLLPDQEERELLLAAAWLHDIGYAPELAATGFHPLDGARHLQALGVGRRLCCLVAHHSGARFEAEERGLANELVAFPPEDSPVMDALVFADMTTSPQGEPVAFEQRIDEILQRYPAGHPVHRAIRRARPTLYGAVVRTRERLASVQPMYGSRRPAR